MRDPQWAIDELRRLADKVEESEQASASSAASEIRHHADRIQETQQTLVQELMKSSYYLAVLGKDEVNLLDSEEVRDYSDGIFNQRSYR